MRRVGWRGGQGYTSVGHAAPSAMVGMGFLSLHEMGNCWRVLSKGVVLSELF